MRIKRHVVQVLALTAGLWAVSGVARADIRQASRPHGWQQMAVEQAAGDEMGTRHEVYAVYAQWTGLPPEQRQQMRQQMRQHWQQMPPEQREIRRQEYRDRWQQVPWDERQRIREEIREQRGGYGGRGHRR